ncbi:MAG: hypothetical protein ACRCSN_13635 [Dermatophilaceae bacterium]
MTTHPALGAQRRLPGALVPHRHDPLTDTPRASSSDRAVRGRGRGQPSRYHHPSAATRHPPVWLDARMTEATSTVHVDPSRRGEPAPEHRRVGAEVVDGHPG